MKSIILSIIFLSLSITTQAKAASSVDFDKLIDSLSGRCKDTIINFSKNPTYYAYDGEAIYTNDKSVLFVSAGLGNYADIDTIGVFWVKHNDCEKVDEIKLIRYGRSFHKLTIRKNSLTIRTTGSNSSYEKDQTINIEGYLPQLSEKMATKLRLSKDSIADLNSFIDRYRRIGLSKEAKSLLHEAKLLRNKLIQMNSNKEFEIARNKNTMLSFLSYLKEFPNTTKREEIISLIYDLVNKEHNIMGYSWFINKYNDSPLGKKALLNLHKLAYSFAKDEDSIEAYNDFIIAYPYSKQAKLASVQAYKLEKKKFTGWSFGCTRSGERNSRALLVESKQMTRTMKNAEGNTDGYVLVIDRMNKLLQDEFPAEEATLRHLESEEFKDFFNGLNRSLNRISTTLNKIESNTNNLSSILKSQSNMMNQHFKEAAQSRKQAEIYTKEYRFWDRYMRKEQGR